MSAAELALFAWLSPAFPIGAFAYSHGLEWAVETGDVKDAASLGAWLTDLVDHGAPRSDAIIMAEAWRVAAVKNCEALGAVNDLALALAPSQERHLETKAQGNAFVAATVAAWPCPALDLLQESVRGDIAFPVALGVAASGHGIDLQPLLETFVIAFCSNLVSAAVRLGAIGQTEAQRIIAASCEPARKLAGFAAKASLDDLGTCTLRSDIAAMRHETQYSRLFRS
jgi:urease accessory protein